MIQGINTVILQGELCWPELKYTGSGSALFKAKIRIPITDSRNGGAKDSYVRITAWDEFAEALHVLPPKSNVRISGRIQDRSYSNKNGQKQNVTDIVVDGLEVVEEDTGSNGFVLQGELMWPDFKTVGPNNTPLFKAKLKIPYEDARSPGDIKNSYVKIVAWNELAEQLSSISTGGVKVSGHVQERPWLDRTTNQKRIFTDAVVTNFVPVEE